MPAPASTTDENSPCSCSRTPSIRAELERTRAEFSRWSSRLARDVQPLLPALLRVALWHLLSTAAKFTRASGAVRIQVQVLSTGPGCRIAVLDKGEGFRSEPADRLFQAFERLHDDEEFGGKDIGLAIVREIAHRHGGRVGGESPEAQGSRFWIEFPWTTRVADEPTQDARSPAPPEATRRLVVVIDSEPLVLLTLRSLLEQDGHEVLIARGGDEGLQLLRTLASQGRRVNVLISDWLMAQTQGDPIALAARTLHSGVHVVILTGGRGADAGAETIGTAADLILAKPVPSAELRRAVASVAPT